LKALSGVQPARGRATFRFSLSRPAKVRLQIETKTGVVMRNLPPVALQTGQQSVVWDGRLPLGTRAYSGTYVGHVVASTSRRPFLDRYGRWLHLTHDRIDRADRWFDRWDDWAVFLGRITPVARSFISIPAGVFEMPFRRYNVFTLLGNALWCVVLAGAGWALG